MLCCVKSCLALCDAMNCSLPGLLLLLLLLLLLCPLGFSKQEYWSGLPFPSPGDLFQPGDPTCISCIGGWVLYHWAICEATLSLAWLESQPLSFQKLSLRIPIPESRNLVSCCVFSNKSSPSGKPKHFRNDKVWEALVNEKIVKVKKKKSIVLVPGPILKGWSY